MKKNLQKFGKTLKELRIRKGLSLRKACELASYDPSNWSKVERGIISPPSARDVLARWARILGIKSDQYIQKFIDTATIAQGIIPRDILANKSVVERLPAFFRTLRNKKPTKEEIDRLIELVRNA